MRAQSGENPYLDTAVQAALSAGKLLKDALGKEFGIEFKGEIDIVTELDRAAECEIISIIESSYPTHGILTEESSERKAKSGYRWIIDPLDGTTNFSHAFPVFCVSIALEIDGIIALGVVYDPTRDELFTATLGGKAYLNGELIEVSKVEELNTSLLATGFPYDIRTSKENNLDHFASFAVRVQAIRRAGSAALDLCYVACGRYDGFWELKLKPWDIAAGILIVTEAGGRVSDFTGAAVEGIENKRLLASNGHLHEAMSEVLVDN